MQSDLKNLSKVADIYAGFAFKSKNFSSKGIPIIRISNINNSEEVVILNKNQPYYPFILDEKLRKFIVKKYDILIALSGATTGKIGIYKKDKQALLNQRIALIRSKDGNSNKYIYYFLQTKSQQILSDAYGGAQPNISPKQLAKYDVYYPKEERRQLIVQEIETQFTRLDAAVKSLKSIKKKLDTYRKSVLKAAFEGKPVKKLGEISSLITKGASPRWQGIFYTDAENGVLFITSENVRSGYIDISRPKYVEKKFNDKQKRSILNKGDVLLNIVGASIGRASIFNEDKLANINQAVALIRVPNEKYRTYICYFLNSNFARAYYAKQKVDVARANLSLKNVYDVPLPLCDDSEVENIVNDIESRFSVTDKLEQTIDNALIKAEQLRKSILKSAFEGKLVKYEGGNNYD